jgi:penicillin-binding protein 1B
VNKPNQEPEQKNSLLKRGLWRLLFLFIGLLVGIGIPYIWYLDKQVRDQFAQLNWQVPSKVYARPLELKLGLALDGASLESELLAGGYKNDGQAKMPGTYTRNGGRFKIATREFFDVDGKVPAKRLDVLLISGRIAVVRAVDSGRALPIAKVDPVRIATLYGNNTEERRLVKIDPVSYTHLRAHETM